jgi:hypothetical protein
MTKRTAHKQPTPFDELVTQLLECGGVLSQIISSMVQFEASGKSPPGIAPIPEVAHSLILGVTTDLTRKYSEDEIATCARVVEDMTTAISEQIFAVDLDLF